MNVLLPFIVTGLVTGTVYGLAGTGLVLTYKTSGIFNFGYGALATAAAYVFYFLHVDLELEWGWSALVAVGIVGPLLGLAMEPIARALSVRPLAYKVVGTVGLIVGVQGIATLIYGPDTIAVDQFLPGGADSFPLLGTLVAYSQLVVVIISVLVALGLYLMFRLTRAGTLMRAVVDDSDLLAIHGTNPVRVRRTAWIIGSTLAALSGVLVLPTLGLNPTILNLLVVQAFGAAAVGAFSSVPLTFLGGLIIGVGSSLSSKFVAQIPWLTGLPAGLPFLLLFAVLLLLPRRKLVPASTVESRPRLNYQGPVRSRVLCGGVVLALLVVVPTFAGARLPFFTMALALSIVLLSLGLLVKTSGQVSLCHATFMAIGACIFSKFTTQQGMPWFVALLLAALVVVPVGAIIAIPAIRLSGLFLALATFGFAILVEQFFFPLDILFGTVGSGREIPRPSFAEDDNAYYYLVLGIVVLSALGIMAIHKGRIGRILRGMSQSPLAVGTFGLNTNVTRVIVFSISTFLAAIGGILYASTFHFASAGDPRFTNLFSLVLLIMLMISPFREPWYVLPAAVGISIPAFWDSADSPYWINALTGAAAIAVAVQGGPPVLPEKWRAVITRLFAKRKPGRAEDEHAPVATPRRPAGRGSLEVHDLTVRFGGVLAVDGLTLTAPPGQITGLIGPNGAGKTTTFNACSGLNRPSAGRIVLRGQEISGYSPAARARLGLGRTFQRMELCDALTVFENVALGLESGQAGSSPLLQVAAPRDQLRRSRSATREALRLVGIQNLADRRAGELSTGQRRLVELARCLAGDFDILLLDEPSSGLDPTETWQFGELLRTIVRERGCSVLLVEHDVNLVLEVCARIYVLDFGKLLFAGTPGEVAASPAVRAAYLGEESPASAHLDGELAGAGAEEVL